MASTLTELELIELGRELDAELSLGKMEQLKDQDLERLGLELEEDLAALDVEDLAVSLLGQNWVASDG
ncbi:MAG: hypothetical protein FJY95_06965 [Candidatus Handelsmanbacteria bacterium]|nr:hypothetical protein [Candidatus Handelsmanbacteria bacterium]